MSGAIPLLPLCAFKACIGKTLPFPSPLPIISLWKGGGVFPFVVARLSCSVDTTDHVAWQKVKEGVVL
jgi:hypothetical protein